MIADEVSGVCLRSWLILNFFATFALFFASLRLESFELRLVQEPLTAKFAKGKGRRVREEITLSSEQQISRNKNEEQHRNNSIHGEERSIQFRQIIGPHQ